MSVRQVKVHGRKVWQARVAYHGLRKAEMDHGVRATVPPGWRMLACAGCGKTLRATCCRDCGNKSPD